MNYTDEDIVKGILNNDKNIIKYFFVEKCSTLFAYILLNIFDGNIDKRELINELYIYLANDNWKKIRQFDFCSKLITWASVVAVRFFQKKRKELIGKELITTLNDKMGLSQNHIKSIDQRMDLHSMLIKMPNKRYRKVIEVLDLQDIRPEILAEEMGVTVDNLYNIHRRALVQLRLVMGRKEEYYD